MTCKLVRGKIRKKTPHECRQQYLLELGKLDIILPAMKQRKMEEVDTAVLHIGSKGWWYSGQNVSRPTTVSNREVFPQEKNIFLFFKQSGSRYTTACLYNFSRNTPSIWPAYVPYYPKKHREKNDSTLKPSNSEAMPNFCTFSAQKSKCPRRFLEIDPETLHPCYSSPSRRSTCGFCIHFFRRK